MLPLVGLWAQLRQLEKAFVNKALLLAATGKSSDSEQTKVSSHSTLHPRAVSTQRALHLLQKYLPNSMRASATQTLVVNYLLGPVQCYIFTHKCPDSLGVAPCDPFHTKTRKLRQSLHSDWHKPRVKSDKGRTTNLQCAPQFGVFCSWPSHPLPYRSAFSPHPETQFQAVSKNGMPWG